MWRWSLLTGGLIALFWLIWRFSAGSVPVVQNVKVTDSWTWELPFRISRWWDVLIGPIWSVVVISLFPARKSSSREGTSSVLVTVGLALGLIVSLIYGLVFGLIVSLTYGLTYTLVLGLAIGLAYSLVIGLKWLSSRKVLQAAGSWLLAKN